MPPSYNALADEPEEKTPVKSGKIIQNVTTDYSTYNRKPFEGPNVMEIEGEKFFSDGNGGKWYDDQPKSKFKFDCYKLM